MFPAICIIFALLLESAGGFLITVDAHEEICFHEHVLENERITISFEVMEGGFKDIGVSIKGPEEELLHHSDRDSVGSFTFSASKRGVYTLCFDNQLSTLTPKVLMFQFHVIRGLAYYTDPQRRGDDVLEQAIVQLMINELSGKMIAVKQEQEYMHVRYRGHLAVSDSVHFRIVSWSIFGPSMLLIMTVLEVYYLKRFFEVRRVV
ncbi:transmembrane emp24 domain-containing protein 2-like [Drosophila miranda]|uniref:transmembrane emp24 domain-containing protein 2-like n=1 Tax=Drosophila miranda TaxID=7229 RepID=UPI00143F6912|nr:transmembrane emp24 domain-containing protein 2-like [Drosophila miranda]